MPRPVLVGVLAQLDEDQLTLGLEAEPDEARAEQRDRRLLHRGGLPQLGTDLDRILGELLGDPLEERDRFAREEGDLLLLDEHGESGVRLRGLDQEGAAPGLAHRPDGEQVDGLEVVGIRQRRAPAAVRRGRGR